MWDGYNVHIMSRVGNFEKKMIIKILNLEIEHVYQQKTIENNIIHNMKNISNVVSEVTLYESRRRQKILYNRDFHQIRMKNLNEIKNSEQK